MRLIFRSGAIPILLALTIASMSSMALAPQDSVIIYGGGDNYPPYEFINRKGQPDGFHIDLMNSIANVMGIKVEFKLGHWANISQELHADGSIDLSDMFRIPEREDLYEFANAHAVVAHQVVTREESDEISDLNQLAGSKIFVEKGTAIIEKLNQQNIGITVIPVESEVEALRQLAAGLGNAAIVSQHQAHVLIEKYQLSNLLVSNTVVLPLQLSFVSVKGNLELINQLNTGLEILKRTGEYSRIYSKWFGKINDNTSLIIYAKWTSFAVIIITVAGIIWIISLQKLVKRRTDRIKKELRIKIDTERELKARNKELKKKTEELDKFVYSISHDIRSPITSILGLIDIMRIELRDQLAQDYADKIGESIDKLIQYIDHLLSYWANEREGINIEPIDFEDVVQEAVAFSRGIDGADKVLVNVELDIAQPFNSDKRRITLILRNLIRNGIEYRSSKSSQPFINLKIRNVQDHLDIEIEDNGEGMDQEKQNSIFDMFYRGSNKSQGCGLGLYITREAIKKLGGDVAVKSMPGHGTSFFISLPQMV